jgi:hypothetical protein
LLASSMAKYSLFIHNRNRNLVCKLVLVTCLYPL